MYPIAELIMKDGRKMRFELYPDAAPNTVASFTALCNDGFFDGLIFHRVVKDYVIQSGSPVGSCGGSKAPFFIRGEFSSNGFDNPTKHTRGTLSMARRRENDSASTQIFIVHKTAERLDGKYAAFGRLCDDESFAVLDEIASVETSSPEMENRPLVPQVIQSFRVHANGWNISAPERLPGEE